MIRVSEIAGTGKNAGKTEIRISMAGKELRQATEAAKAHGMSWGEWVKGVMRDTLRVSAKA